MQALAKKSAEFLLSKIKTLLEMTPADDVIQSWRDVSFCIILYICFHVISTNFFTFQEEANPPEEKKEKKGMAGGSV